MAESDPTTPQIVEEFPPPPAFYKIDHTNISPPTIPETNPYLISYGGIFSSIIQERPVYDESKDYKSVLKNHLKNIMEYALKLVPYSDHTDFEISQQALTLKNELAIIHSVLAEYRIHEARANHCTELKRQLEEMKEMEATLQRCLETNQQELTALV